MVVYPFTSLPSAPTIIFTFIVSPTTVVFSTNEKFTQLCPPTNSSNFFRSRKNSVVTSGRANNLHSLERPKETLGLNLAMFYVFLYLANKMLWGIHNVYSMSPGWPYSSSLLREPINELMGNTVNSMANVLIVTLMDPYWVKIRDGRNCRNNWERIR